MIRLINGDITKIKVDAIVNAANTSLLGGGGVDGAIHRAGGKEILEECYKIRNRQGACKVGGAVITKAGDLPCKYVIHTVGPKWNGGKNNEEELLKKAYTNTLIIALENNIKSLAFPNISTGIYGYPKEKAAVIAIDTIISFTNKKTILEEVIFVCFDNENYNYYKKKLLKKGYIL
ncbi:MAG: O-acetyl-ADP-ribose deacetylase [Winogradskyella sp.]